MMKLLSITALASLLASVPLASSQLSGSVGPLTTRASKSAKKICNVLDYGAIASTSSDIGPPLVSAFEACSSGGTVYVPPGNYGMETWAVLTGGEAWALQLDGIIFRTGTASGTMISIASTTDFEFFSSTSKGAIQGYGYVFHAVGEYGPRILRLTDVTDFSIHDVALVDAGAFHLVLDTATNGEVYNTIIRGGNEGGLDGIDVWGNNVWIHDVEVTNKDECVTVKSPATNILIENIYCNWSGGCSIGSLGVDTAISKVTYENVYTWESNQMLLIKSNGGSGTVSNCNFNNFIGHSNAYSLDVNAFWTDEALAAGNGVLFTDLTFNNWTGTCANGVQRGPVQIICPTDQPCDGLTITDFDMWTDSGNEIYYVCENAWGSGACLAHGTEHTAFAAVTSTIAAAPSGYNAAKMPSDLASGFPLTASIPIPAVPTSFFPGATPISKLLG